MLVILKDSLGMKINYAHFIKIQAFKWSFFPSYTFQVLINTISVLI